MTWSDPKLRHHISDAFVALGKPVYTWMRRRRAPWATTKDDLRQMPEGSLGHALGAFLDEQGFDLMPRAEFHDVLHVLFDIGTTMREETCVQFVVLGNGRWTLPNVLSSGVAFALYPEWWTSFARAFGRGRRAARFHDADFEAWLADDLRALQGRLRLLDAGATEAARALNRPQPSS